MDNAASLQVAPASGDTDERENDVREALRAVIDPEINIDVVTLGLIRKIVFDDSGAEVTMTLTTPFCPYGGAMVQQVKTITAEVSGVEVRVVMGDEQWSPDMMVGGDWSDWGLV